MYKKFIKNTPIKDKTIFIRNDFNVPINEDGGIADDTRIKESLKTINYAIDQNAKIICASHLGRPNGKREEKLSLRPIAERLSNLLGEEVTFNSQNSGESIDNLKKNMKNGEVLLLENLRFNSGEKLNTDEFAKELAKNIDVYINDAFATSHRKHASIDRITHHIPISAMGFLIKKETEFLEMALKNPPEKFTIILGGAKVSDKINVIKNLTDKARSILIGGAMAYTFLKAKGEDVGGSQIESEYIDTCKDILESANKKGVKLILPIDHIAATKIENNITIRIIKHGENIPKEMMGLDIGFETVDIFRKVILESQMIFWNGPMGVFEVENFSGGTTSVAEAIAESPAISIAGGGDTIRAINKTGIGDNISHISTGGGALLKFLSGTPLPGLENLTED